MSEEVKVAVIPDCDICLSESPGQKPNPAEYDAKTVYGPWAYMCMAHWLTHSTGRLGTGYGQRLILEQS